MKAAFAMLLVIVALRAARGEDPPHPVKNPESPVMLKGDWAPRDHRNIDFASLPRVPAESIIVSKAAGDGVNQHNYLVQYDGRFWCMWSDGPGVEDRVGQIVKYSTSRDGVTWDAPLPLTPDPAGSGPGSRHYNTRSTEGLRYIARGFWIRDGQLLALVTLDEAAGFFGPSLALHAFGWQAAAKAWKHLGVVQENAINNFPPERLPTGEWAMSRRTYDYKRTGVQFLIGGVKSLQDWQSFPVVTAKDSELKAEEPLWWVLPGGHLVSLIRDNQRSGFLFRSFSTDNGRTWTKPTKTDFPDATSKLHGLRLSSGRYVLVSNANPKRRDPLTLALSDDGMVFDRMFYLVGGRHVDYPHVIEHDGYLYVAHSGAKRSVEIERVKLSDLYELKMPARTVSLPD